MTLKESPRNSDISRQEFELNPKSIGLVTATYYPRYKGRLDIDNPSALSPEQIADTDTIRGNLALKTAEEAMRVGYNLFVSEGGSDEHFLKDLNEMAGVTVMKRPSPGRAVGRRQGYEAAAEIPEIGATIWLEPEKYTLIPIVPEIAKPLLTNELDILVIGRDPQILRETWPTYMWETEVRANNKWNSILYEFDLLPKDKFFDMWAGPKAFRNTPEIVKLWTEKYMFEKGLNISDKNTTGWDSIRKYIKPEQYSDGQYFPILHALNERRLDPENGPRVDGRYFKLLRYPEIQRLNEMTPEKEAEFKDKRKDQFYGFMNETVQYIRYLRDPDGKKTKLHLVEETQ